MEPERLKTVISEIWSSPDATSPSMSAEEGQEIIRFWKTMPSCCCFFDACVAYLKRIEENSCPMCNLYDRPGFIVNAHEWIPCFQCNPTETKFHDWLTRRRGDGRNRSNP